MHLDLLTANAQEQQAEVERLISAGAERVGWPYPGNADFVGSQTPRGTYSAW